MLASIVLAPLVFAPVPSGPQDLEVVWESPYSPVDLEIGATGELWVITQDATGSPPLQQLRRISAQGDLVDSVELPIFARGLAWHDDDSVTVVATIAESEPGFAPAPVPSEDDLGLIRYDANLDERWRARLGGSGPDSNPSIGRDGAGGVLLAATTLRRDLGPAFASGVRKPYLARVDASGALLWEVEPLGLSPQSDDFLVLAGGFDPVGGICVGGVVTDAFNSSTPERNVLWRYDPGGQEVYYAPAIVGVMNAPAVTAQGEAFGGYVRCDPALGTCFDGLLSVAPNGSVRWSAQRGFCDGLTCGIDSAGAGWMLGREDSSGLCGFGTLGPLVLQAYDLASGATLDTRAVPQGLLGRVFFGPLDQLAGRLGGPLVRLSSLVDVSTPVCNGEMNSTGVAAELRYVGRAEVADNDALLGASALPPGQTTLFLVSFGSGLITSPGGSQGNLCLASPFGRFNRAGEVCLSTPAGRCALSVDLQDLPIPPAPMSVLAGQVGFFQAWYRDGNPGPTSNFTAAVAVPYR